MSDVVDGDLENFSLEEPFAGYKNFKDCVAKNSKKKNPQAYCATIMRKVEASMNGMNEESEGDNIVGNRVRDLPIDERNALPDLAFAIIKEGGDKDSGGRTYPYSLRQLPHHKATVAEGHSNASVDPALLRRALSLVDSTDVFLNSTQRERARRHLETHLMYMSESTSESAADEGESQDDRANRIRRDFDAAMYDSADPWGAPWIVDIYTDSVVARCSKSGRYYEYALTETGGVFTFGEPVEVRKTYTPVSATTKESDDPLPVTPPASPWIVPMPYGGQWTPYPYWQPSSTGDAPFIQDGDSTSNGWKWIVDTLATVQVSTESIHDQVIDMASSIEASSMESTGTLEIDTLEEAKWDTAYVNDLPDSSFAAISPGGKKDADGKTTPRSLRHLPYKDASGTVDKAHLRNALARLSQTKISQSLKASALKKLRAAAKKVGVTVSTESLETSQDQQDNTDVDVQSA